MWQLLRWVVGFVCLSEAKWKILAGEIIQWTKISSWNWGDSTLCCTKVTDGPVQNRLFLELPPIRPQHWKITVVSLYSNFCLSRIHCIVPPHSNIPFPKLTQSISQTAPLTLSIPAQQRQIFYSPELKTIGILGHQETRGSSYHVTTLWLICRRCIGRVSPQEGWEKFLHICNHPACSTIGWSMWFLLSNNWNLCNLNCNWWLISAHRSSRAQRSRWWMGLISQPSYHRRAAVGSHLLLSSCPQSKLSKT